jgi:hypothetical protein
MTPGGGTTRGQTTVDYAVGIGLFLLAVAFVFAVLPGLVSPYSTQGGQPTVADRTAEQLTDDVIGRTDAPGVLNETCTARLFNDTMAPRSCSFPVITDNRTDNENITKAVGVSNYTYINITVVEDGTVTILNTSRGADRNRTRLALGRPVPEGSVSVATARRTVVLNGTVQELRVRVW